MKPIIDISFYQAPSALDYDLIAANVSGVILRACYGIWKDTAFDRHYQELAQIRGVPVGAYHYIIGSVGIQEQADAFNLAVGLKDMRLGCWIDVEDRRAGTRIYRQQVLDYAALQPDMGVYTSKSAWAEIMGGAYLTDRKLWVAHYTANPYPLLPQGWDSWWLWQHTSTGRLPGYTGNLDTNRFYGDDADFAAWIGGEVPAPIEKLFDAKVYEWATPHVNIRKEPSINSEDIGNIYPNEVVGVTSIVNDWYGISNGFVMSKFLQRLDFTPPPILIDIPPLSQRDTRWASVKLGNSNLTIGSHGCLVTCLAMVAGVTPAMFNNRLREVNGFTGANVYWKMVEVAYPQLDYYKFIDCQYVPAPLDEIDAMLALNIPVEVEVDFNPDTPAVDQHWILIIGKSGDDYIVNDPWTGERISFRAKYGDPARWIFRIVAYRRNN